MGVLIYDNYNRPKVNQEPGGGEKITESAGYIPIKVQVETMLIVGQRLGEYRAEKYDYAGGEEVPTMSYQILRGRVTSTSQTVLKWV